MTASQIPFETGAFTAPVIDYEPPAFNVAVGPAAKLDVAGRTAREPDVATRAAACPTPSSAALHLSPRRGSRVAHNAAETAPPSQAALPPAAAAFADAALRRVLEVIDRRRPLAQLRPMLTPALMDMVFALTRSTGPEKAAVLRRVRLRVAAVDEQDAHRPVAAEVFATYTRGPRTRALAARIEVDEGRWRMVALQIG